METVCQLSYPLNSENASPPGTCTVYLPCPASCAVTALPPRTPSTTSETAMIPTGASPLLFISTPLFPLCAAIEELVTHRFGEGLAKLERQRLPGKLVALLRAFLAGRIAQGDLAAGLLRQEALVMDAARDQVSGLVPHRHLLRDDLAIAPPVTIGHPRAAAQDLSNAGRRVDLPFLAPPQVAEEVVEIPALELAVRLLIDDHGRHRSAERRGRRVPRVRLVETLDVVLDHLVGDRELERAEILARVDVRRDHACDPPGQNPEYATGESLRQTRRCQREPRVEYPPFRF